jgi:hypothetical protein
MTATAAPVTSTRVTAASMSPAGTAAAWPTTTTGSPAGTADPRTSAGTAHYRTSTRAPAVPYPARSATLPAMPSRAAAPTEAAAESITAPIEPGTTPAIVVPAVVSSTEEELSLFHIAGDCRRHEAIDRHSVGLTNRT